MDEEIYLPRIADAQLSEKLKQSRAVVIRGPKWCGKTKTAEQQAASILYLQDPNESERNLLTAQVQPSLLLEGDKPRLIDEWQDAPQLWDAVRFDVDHHRGRGRYILTGSATPTVEPKHTGTGRMGYLDMRTISLSESGESTREVSLTSLLAGETISGRSTKTLEEVAYALCRGGWPDAVVEGGEESLETAYSYITAIASHDISRVDGVQRSEDYARLVLAAYARCSATLADIESVRRNIRTQRGEIARNTVDSYIAALRKLYVFEDLRAWRPSLRDRTRITTTPTRHFTDPSLAVAALGASPDVLLRDIPTLGLLFESLVVRDLRIYVEAQHGELLRYHDQSGLEADAIVSMRDGRWGAIEVKLGEALVEEGAESLRKVARKVNQSEMGAPSFLAVIIPSGYAYRRDDGIYVVPITCLRP